MKQVTFTDAATGFTTTVTVTENTDGTLSFAIDVDETTGVTGDLRALYLNTTNDADYNLMVMSGEGSDAAVTHWRDEANAIRRVDSKDTNINGEVLHENGGAFDAGFEFGRQGIATDDVQHMEFTIAASDGTALTLDSFDWTTLGLRVTSVGDVDGSRKGSLKLANDDPPPVDSTVVAVDDVGIAAGADVDAGVATAVLSFDGTQFAPMNYSANDDDPDTAGPDLLGDTIFLTRLSGEGTSEATAADAGGFFWVEAVGGGMVGIHQATGEVLVWDQFDELANGQAAEISVTYEIEDLTGAVDTATINILIDPFFTDGD